MKVNGLQLKRNIFGEPEKLNEYPLNTVRQPLNKNIGRENDQDFESKTWNRSKSIGFLHCGKCGGTSIDRTLGPIVQSLSKKKIDSYIGNMHYDWSYFELFEKDSIEPIIMLRDPVERSVSNYFFKKTIPDIIKSKDPICKKFMKSSFDEFMDDPELLAEFGGLWLDGFAGLSMIDGVITGSYYGTNVKEIYKYEKEKLENVFIERQLKTLNASWSLNLAADRLENMGWFGILERMEESEELLSKYIGKNIKLSHVRKTEDLIGRKSSASAAVLRKLNALKPLNKWLYDFANRLLDARIIFLRTGIYRRPKREELPKMTCYATFLIRYCPNKELNFWISKNASERYEARFWKLLYKFGETIANDKRDLYLF